MKSILPVLLAMSFVLTALHAWQPVPDTMLTQWGEKVTPENAWQEYPRPQMVRKNWSNLNGLWDVAVTGNRAEQPKQWQEQILVPYALETPLSGIGRRLKSDEVIWYRRSFSVKGFSAKQLLHFEGVDYKCRVWVNGELVGSHVGGNLPFSFDISDAVRKGTNELVLRVIDGTDDPDLYQLRGKQKRDNSGIWYTPSSGIWATVWMESVPDTYIDRVKLLADMHGELQARAQIGGGNEFVQLKVTVLEDGKELMSKTGACTQVTLNLKHPKLWSPDSPNLYDLKIDLLDKTGKVIDSVESYTGFRTVGKACDADGNWRFTLNGNEIFHLGPLDQGWWPDSFLNPPSDEAMVSDMEYLKKAGFNMIRKHKKVEPRRYYYHSDRLGLLVWQDQVSGGSGGPEWPKWQRLYAVRPDYKDYEKRPHWWRSGDSLDADWPDWAHEQYMDELKTMIDTLYNNPSVVVWTAFNERWGQHRSLKIGNWIKSYDASRHLNIASGGNFFEIGDIADEHAYPEPAYPLDIDRYNDYIKVMGEFGGHGWPVQGHLWDTEKRNWGYGGLPETIEEYVGRFENSMKILGELKERGVAAGVYTQTTDVEGELNGLITYDRKVAKIPPEKVAQIFRDAGLIE
jgi:beta-galactosidase